MPSVRAAFFYDVVDECKVRSRYADIFNHDDEAGGFDTDVLDESNPVRAGYQSALDWIVKNTTAGQHKSILELGSGTGNLTAKLDSTCRITCVDISERMSELAQQKLDDRQNISWHTADVLEYVYNCNTRYDRIVSSYALHHLTEEEKEKFFTRIDNILDQQGKTVIADLMFENFDERKRIITELLSAGHDELVDDINSEFFWDLSRTTELLDGKALKSETRRFSLLSWGLLVYR